MFRNFATTGNLPRDEVCPGSAFTITQQLSVGELLTVCAASPALSVGKRCRQNAEIGIAVHRR
jgi:hypothetical protein